MYLCHEPLRGVSPGVQHDVLWVDEVLLEDHELPVGADGGLAVAEHGVIPPGLEGRVNGLVVRLEDPEHLPATHAAEEERIDAVVEVGALRLANNTCIQFIHNSESYYLPYLRDKYALIFLELLYTFFLFCMTNLCLVKHFRNRNA